MSGRTPWKSRRPADWNTITPRMVVAVAISVLVVLFIVLNRHETTISFIVFSHRTALWIALTAAAAGGFVAGYLVSRRRYRR